MYLAETVLFMIVITSQKLTIDTNLVYRWSQLKFRKDKRELFPIKFPHIMDMVPQKIVLVAFFPFSLNPLKKI